MLNTFKKIGFVILLLLIAIGVSIWQPWKYLFDLALIGNNSALTVNSTGGKSEVYLDGEKLGETPLSLDNLSPGDYSMEIKRVTSNQDFYTTITKEIHIEHNTRTLVEVEIGPSEQFSSTSVVYFRENDSRETSIYVSTNPPEATVTFDNGNVGSSPVVIEDAIPGEHIIKVALSGYEEKEISVISRDGYTLIAEFDLMIKPIEIK